MGQCLKCGKETEASAVFCTACQEDMSRYPIKPGTVAHLPKRPSVVKNEPQLEDDILITQLHRQRLLIRWMLASIAALSVTLLVTGVLLLHTLQEQPILPNIGRNYTTSTSGNHP